MVKILTKIWPSGDGSEENIAYAIAVAQAMLNPKYEKITMSDTAIKHKIAKNLTYKRPRVETSEREDQEDSPEDLKEAKQEPEDNDSNNVKKEPVRKNKNISKKFSKIYKRPRVETSEIEWEDQDELSEDLNEAENEPENNDSRASSFLSSDDDNNSKKETDDDSKKETDESDE
ncbi:hypothetical protein F8M41_023159 [Gigaspora margarita]|uniref:Uncharacterized protein n=1 Tax=Gigaspora margarita TaxID=4874 RepID=A0A8H4EHF0_GIGMA|nr:hypothetical protein F8M41_023159 [Gigaspora margarita]